MTKSNDGLMADRFDDQALGLERHAGETEQVLAGYSDGERSAAINYIAAMRAAARAARDMAILHRVRNN